MTRNQGLEPLDIGVHPWDNDMKANKNGPSVIGVEPPRLGPNHLIGVAMNQTTAHRRELPQGRTRTAPPESSLKLWKSAAVDPTDIETFRAFGAASYLKQFVYLLQDGCGNLLYVGITWNPLGRWRAHRSNKSWWGEVTAADVYLCESVNSARDWESWCIKNLDPEHNIHQRVTAS